MVACSVVYFKERAVFSTVVNCVTIDTKKIYNKTISDLVVFETVYQAVTERVTVFNKFL